MLDKAAIFTVPQDRTHRRSQDEGLGTFRQTIDVWGR
jgi:hypothetical protein